MTTATIERQPEKNETFTSTGSKLLWHQDALADLSKKKAHPVTCHILPQNTCNMKCGFCSVGERPDNVLTRHQIETYLDQLVPLGLKSVIISGGGNPILWVCPETKSRFPDLIDLVHDRGLQIGLITNGVKMKDFDGRMSYPMLPPEQLDKITWLRISLAGWDDPLGYCPTPDVNPEITTLGGSWVFHDIFLEPTHKRHGRVSTPQDVVTPLSADDLAGKTGRITYGEDRVEEMTEKLAGWVEDHRPEYVRLLPDCLRPDLIEHRCKILQSMADSINPEVVFVQNKPPRQPKACYKGATHPVLDASGDVFSCDSVVLNDDANHQFDKKWAFARWDTIGEVFSKPLEPMAPCNACPGCVFPSQVDWLNEIVEGGASIPATPAGPEPTHKNFI